MFTGIVEELGTAVEPAPRLRIRCRTVLQDASEGSSIAVNGVCLTALDLRPDSFSADLAPETLARTNLGALKPGSVVNLERPMQLNARLSGHLVQGHVDATSEILALDSIGDGNYWLKVRVPPALERYMVFKGSIAIDGISLTIAEIQDGILGVTIIPHTFLNTTMRAYSPGSRVNIECDMLAKHVEKLLGALRTTS
jgi:riboflavin synthase